MTPLRALRVEAGMSREELAREMDVSVRTIVNYESNLKKMSAMSIGRLLTACELFDITPNDFLQGVKM